MAAQHLTSSLIIDDIPKVQLSSDQLQHFKAGAIFDIYTPEQYTTPPPSSSSQQSKSTSSTIPFYLGGPISSLDYHASGLFCLATTLHHKSLLPQQIQKTLHYSNYQYINPNEYKSNVHLFNSSRGTHIRMTTFDKYYIDIAKFTHHQSAILHSGFRSDTTSQSNNNNNNTAGISVGYTSLTDGKQLQEFTGHTDKIISISLNPVHDSFITTSLDRSVRLYDLRSALTQGMISTQAPGLSAIDPQGIVFAVTGKDNCIKMYDFRTIESGPFTTIWLSNLPPVNFTSIEFSPDGTMMIVGATPQQTVGDDIGDLTHNTTTTNNNNNMTSTDTDHTNINNPNPNQANNMSNNDELLVESGLGNVTFAAFNYILLIDAFNGQVLQRIATPRNTYPLDRDILKSINVADEEMIEYAPNKVQPSQQQQQQQPPTLPQFYGQSIHPINQPTIGQMGISGYAPTYDVTNMHSNTQNNNMNNHNLNNNQQNNNPQHNQQNNPTKNKNNNLYQNSSSWISHTQIHHPLLTQPFSSTTINPKLYNLPLPNAPLPCSMSADCKYITFGTHIGSVPTHDTRNGKQLTTFAHKHQAPITQMKWNPTRVQLATADAYELCFWVPTAK